MDSETKTLLDWLLARHPDTPRTRAKQWIVAGRVCVNGKVLRRPQETMVDPGHGFELRSRHATSVDFGAGWHIHPRVTLLYIDSAIAIVNKGASLLSVPGPAVQLSALSILADFLEGKIRARGHGMAGRTLPPAFRRLRPLPVHRLDQYTSGVFCLATNPTARHHLIEQLKAHTMSREYIAFVEGKCPATEGVWRHWLRLSENELRQQVLSDEQARSVGAEAREAVTRYQVMAEYPIDGGRFVTKLRLRLETGRKHQIRAQAAFMGLPLAGDRTYNPGWYGSKRTGTAIDFPRQALHAEVLTLEHPERTGNRVSWKAGMPKDLQQLEGALRAGRVQSPSS